MPDQTEQSAPSDNVITKLNETIGQQHDLIGTQVTEIDRLTKRVKELEQKLKGAKSAPTGDVVYIGGQSHPILKTVRANTTFDEVKKGNVDEGSTLVVIAAPH